MLGKVVMSVFTVLWMESTEAMRTSANDGWLCAGMQKTDIGLAPLVKCPVCPVTNGRGPKKRPDPARILGLSGRVSLGRAGPGFRLDLYDLNIDVPKGQPTVVEGGSTTRLKLEAAVIHVDSYGFLFIRYRLNLATV